MTADLDAMAAEVLRVRAATSRPRTRATEAMIDELEQLQARNDRLRAEVAALEALRGER